MSELSAAAAAALGVPEAIVMRSAAARATETGMSVDEVLSAWAGGGSLDAPAPPTPAEEAAPPPAQPDAEPAPPQAAPEVVIEIPAAATAVPKTPSPALAPSGKPPVLVGEPDKPMSVLIAAAGLFVAILLVGLVGPSIPTENPGARSTDLAHSEAGLRGRDLYRNLGCASCHTQMVRPIVADVGLGAVSLNDSNQVLGTRRFGPDLSDIGARMSGTQIEATILGDAGHPGTSLSGDDLDDLVTYLVESVTTVPGGEEPAPEEEPAPGDEAPGEGAEAALGGGS